MNSNIKLLSGPFDSDSVPADKSVGGVVSIAIFVGISVAVKRTELLQSVPTASFSIGTFGSAGAGVPSISFIIILKSFTGIKVV